MKKTTLFSGAALSLGLGVLFTASAFAAPADPSFNDTALYNCIKEAYVAGGGTISDVSTGGLPIEVALTNEQLASITEMTCNERNVTDLTGLEKLSNLETLDLSNNLLTVVDLTANTHLKTIIINKNPLTKITIPFSTERLDIWRNSSETPLEIDTSKATGLFQFNVYENKAVKSLDLSKNTNLTVANICGNGGLDFVDITKNTKIQSLNVTPLVSPVCTDFEKDIPVFKANTPEVEIPGAISMPIIDGQQTVITTDPTKAYDLTAILRPTGFIDESTIQNNDVYSYDPDDNLLLINDEDAIHGYVTIGVGPNVKLYVPINDQPAPGPSDDDEQQPSSDEDLEVPETSKDNPDTSTANGLILGLSVLGIAVLGVAIKAILSAKKA